MGQTNATTALQFTEEMKGFVTFGATNFQDGYDQGRAAGTALMFHLTIRTEDLDRFLSSTDHEAAAMGYVACDQFGGRRPVERGTFNLFVDTADRNSKKMRYRLFFRDAEGRPLTLTGFKLAQMVVTPEVWANTTTLYTNIFSGHVEADQESSAQLVAAGIIHIEVPDFLRELTTLRAFAPTAQARAEGVEKFGRFFLGSLWDVYRPRLLPKLGDFEREIPLYTTEGVRDAEITIHPFQTGDRLGLTLTRFLREPCDDVVVIIHGLTTSTDMFIMPEHENLVSYLLDRGYTDVWSLDFRMSNRFGYNLHRHRYTMDDIALFDHPAALAEVRKQIGPDRRIHVICHCLGSMSFTMSLFAKAVDGVRSVIANSVALTPRVPGWSKLKLMFGPFLAESVCGFEYINPYWRREPGFSLGKLFALAVDLFHHECDSSECHMLSFLWGTGFPALYNHENLLDITHRRGGDLYGGTSVNYHRHVRKMVFSNNTAVKYDPSDPRLAALPNDYFQYAREIETPILFVTGERNNVFRDSNLVCHDRLQKIVPGRHELRVFPNYGHQDVFMGKDVSRDIFPHFVEYLDRQRGSRVTRGPHAVMASGPAAVTEARS